MSTWGAESSRTSRSKRPSSQSLLGQRLRADAEGFDVVAGQSASTRDAFCSFELVGHVDVPRRGSARSGLIADVGAEGNLAHGFDAAGDTGVDGAGGDQTGDQMVRLLGRTALAVHGGCAGLPRKSGVQPGRARDVVGLSAGLGDAAADHLLDQQRVDSRPVENSLLCSSEDLGGVQTGEPTSALADRCTDSLDDYWCAHSGLLSL